MSGSPVTAQEVKRANLAVYNRKTVESYEENRSIFNPRRQEAIRGVLRELHSRTGGEDLLDLGCGSGNLLRLARQVFGSVVGLDLAWKLLAGARRTSGVPLLASGDVERLPFEGECFDVITLYAVLHHILDPRATFSEAYRCLRPGGYLYTDHDPTWHFHRFYHLYYRLRYRGRPGFGSDDEEIAEVHNTQGGGLNPERLASTLRDAGFREVEIRYRHTD